MTACLAALSTYCLAERSEAFRQAVKTSRLVKYKLGGMKTAWRILISARVKQPQLNNLQILCNHYSYTISAKTWTIYLAEILKFLPSKVM